MQVISIWKEDCHEPISTWRVLTTVWQQSNYIQIGLRILALMLAQEVYLYDHGEPNLSFTRGIALLGIAPTQYMAH